MSTSCKPCTSAYLNADSNRTRRTSTSIIILFLILSGVLFVTACSSQPIPTATLVSATPELTPTPTQRPATPTPTPTITPQPTSALGLKAADLDGVRIEFWHPWAGDTERAINEALSEFNNNNPYGISVNAIYQGDLNELYEKINIAEPDIGLPNLAVGTNYQIQSWINTGKPVAGLDTYVNDPEWGLSTQEVADFDEIFLNQDIKDGKRFAMPALRSAQLLFYNTTWAEELGFPSPPKTPEQFKTRACIAARANLSNDKTEDDGSGGWLINTTPSSILSWMYAFDSTVTLPNGAGYQFNTPNVEAALEFLKELFDEGCAYEVAASPAEFEFANRRALFITSALTDINYQNSELIRAENNDSWNVVGFPSPMGEPLVSVYGPSYFMFAGTPQENLAAWLVIKWLLSPEQDARMVRARGTFPIRISTYDLLDDYGNENSQWLAAQDLLDRAKAEPGLESWGNVRWILGDVGTQIFRYYFTPDRIPATLELMDETAAELHNRGN